MTTTDDLHALTGAYTLHALDELERARFERHLGSCDTCDGEVREFFETAALLAAAEHEAPPAHLRDAIMAEIAITRQDRPAVPMTIPVVQLPSTAGWRDRLVLPAAAVLAILAIGLTTMVNGLNQRLSAVESTASGVTAVVAAADAQIFEIDADNGVGGRIVFSPTRGEAVFLASGLEAAPDGQAYALWFLDDGFPRAAGLFNADADGRAVHRITADLSELSGLAVTLEPSSGSSIPTSEELIRVNL